MGKEIVKNLFPQKEIVYFGRSTTMYCDGKCDKAWGINSRPRIEVGKNEYWVSDNEFDKAPDNPGTYEGGQSKPKIHSGENMNHWCARECERCKIIDENEKPLKENLINFEERVFIQR